jgi:hypothetical protein
MASPNLIALVFGLLAVPASAWLSRIPSSRPVGWLKQQSATSPATVLDASCALGIDVGTGSARCGVFSLDGKLLGSHSIEIQTFQPEGMPDL